jgi:plasmid replication initiation protein
MGERELEVDELKRILGLEDKYARTSNFISRVVDVAVREINQHSNMKVSYGMRKTGKRITHIQLRFGITGKQTKKKKINPTSEAERIAEFVRANEKLTRGKNDWEIKQQMARAEKRKDS